MLSYGEFIKKHRIASGFKSQRKLADECGISSATISRIESEIQKPEVETIKQLATYLKTTNLVELMVVCGYWDEDDLLEPLNDQVINKIKTPSTNEEAFMRDIELSSEDILKKYNFLIDGKQISKEEAQQLVDFIRFSRSRKP